MFHIVSAVLKFQQQNKHFHLKLFNINKPLINLRDCEVYMIASSRRARGNGT